MDLFNPLAHICRGVESDILNHLIHAPDFQNPTLIARECGRSKSEVIKCLHILADNGVIYRQTKKSRWYGIDPYSAVGEAWRAFAQLPTIYARELHDIIDAWEDRPTSVTLAHSNWARAFDAVNLLVVIHEPAVFPLHYQEWQIRHHAKRRFNTTTALLHGSAGQILEEFRMRQINPYAMDWKSRTQVPRHVYGASLTELLAEQEGFEPPGLVGRPLSRRVH